MCQTGQRAVYMKHGTVFRLEIPIARLPNTLFACALVFNVRRRDIQSVARCRQGGWALPIGCVQMVSWMLAVQELHAYRSCCAGRFSLLKPAPMNGTKSKRLILTSVHVVAQGLMSEALSVTKQHNATCLLTFTMTPRC